MDANKQVPRYDFLQEFYTINGELKGNESVSMRDDWLVIPQKEFLSKEKRYHNNFHSYLSIGTSNSLGQKFFKFQDQVKMVEMSQKSIKLVTNV